jgi:three-Cys-motif partner protein
LPKTTTWVLPPHTLAKHQIIREYLVRWFPIMSSREKRLIYFDGFSGPGRYVGGEDGSPLVALKALLEHRDLAAITANTEVVFLFVEAKKARYDHLVSELGALEQSIGGWPPNVRVFHRHASFVDEATKVVADLQGKGMRLAPTFALIDPFGFSGVPMTAIADLLQFPKCELLFNLIFNPINWHLHTEKVAHHMTDLFGCDIDSLRGLSGVERREAILGLYTDQLRTNVGFKFIETFEMYNDRNRLATVLVAGTRHRLGFQKMKEAMWAVDPSGSFAFSDVEATTPLLTLFGDEGPNFDQLDRLIRFRFAGRTVTVDKVEDFVNDETRFLPTQYKRNVLVPLEKAGLLTVDETTRKKRRTYPSGTKLTFPPFGS